MRTPKHLRLAQLLNEEVDRLAPRKRAPVKQRLGDAMFHGSLILVGALVVLTVLYLAIRD